MREDPINAKRQKTAPKLGNDRQTTANVTNGIGCDVQTPAALISALRHATAAIQLRTICVAMGVRHGQD